MINNPEEIINTFNSGVEVLSSMIDSHLSAIYFGLLIFFIISFTKLIINRKDKAEVINNILDVIKYVAVIAVLICKGYIF